MFLSIVSPVYMSQNIVAPLVEQLTNAAKEITNDFEIVLVEDGSADNSWLEIEKAATEKKYVKGIKLSRNFGQHFAITAGLENATGDYVVVTDCDLQEDPKYIPELYKKILEGYEIVYTVRKNREFGFFKNLNSSIFYAVYNFLLDNKFLRPNRSTGVLSMCSRKAVDAILSLNDRSRLYLTMLWWVGFKRTYIEIIHKKRYDGKRSTYNFTRTLTLAIDAITSQSIKLLKLMIGLGFVTFLVSLFLGIGLLIKYFIKPYPFGWAGIATLLMFTTGIVILCIGICGLYIGKTFEQAKQRPMFIVDKTINLSQT